MAQMSQSRGANILHVTLGDSKGGSEQCKVHSPGPTTAPRTAPSHTGPELSLMSLYTRSHSEEVTAVPSSLLQGQTSTPFQKGSKADPAWC